MFHYRHRTRNIAAFRAEPGSHRVGLAIVRHLVELHGGTVSAYSAGRGKGATFAIELPLIPTAQAVSSTWSSG
jgi:signal transduction histidine kinase